MTISVFDCFCAKVTDYSRQVYYQSYINCYVTVTEGNVVAKDNSGLIIALGALLAISLILNIVFVALIIICARKRT